MTALRAEAQPTQPDAAKTVTSATLRAADRLDLPTKVLAPMLGLSGPSVSRMRKGNFLLEPGTKPFELGILFLRLFRSLDAIVGGDESVARAWLGNENAALNGCPIDKIQTIGGLVDVIAYLDARRARV